MSHEQNQHMERMTRLRESLKKLGIEEDLFVTLMQHPDRKIMVQLMTAVAKGLERAEMELVEEKAFTTLEPMGDHWLGKRQGAISLARRLNLVLENALDILTPSSPR